MGDKKYVLMRWKDGWQEVVAIDGDTVRLNKYYVIERLEYFGRLVFERPSGEYPGLIVIDRAPMDIEKIALIDGNDECDLRQISTYKEGDRVEYNYELQIRQGTYIDEVKKNIQEVVSKRGISAKEILSKPDAEKFREIESIAKDTHIVGAKKHEDVVGFIEFLLEKI